MAKEKTITEEKTLYVRKTISGHEESKDFYYKIPHAIKTEEVVDMDAFIPISEALKQLNGKRELTGDEVKSYYDFATGEDTHTRIPFNRSAEYKDIAELSEKIRNKQDNIKSEIKEKQEELAIRQEIASSYKTETKE